MRVYLSRIDIEPFHSSVNTKIPMVQSLLQTHYGVALQRGCKGRLLADTTYTYRILMAHCNQNIILIRKMPLKKSDTNAFGKRNAFVYRKRSL